MIGQATSFQTWAMSMFSELLLFLNSHHWCLPDNFCATSYKMCVLVCFQLPYEIWFEDIRQILYIPCHTQTSIKQRPGLFAICLVLGFSRIGSLLTLSCRKCWQWLNQGTKKTFNSITFNLFCLILGFLVVFFNQFAVCNVYLMAKGFIN